MRAVLLYGENDLRIEDVPDPSPAPGELLIAVAHNGLCGSDLQLLRMPRRWEKPVPLGHEFAGTVRVLGDGVTGFEVGDAVCIQPNIPCESCAACSVGLVHLCRTRTFIGTNPRYGGGLSERIAVPASRVHRLPGSISLELGALVEPMAVALNAIRRSGIQAGQRSLIVGAGPIGIATYLGLRAVGVDDVVVSEPAPVRRKVIADLGADVLEPEEGDVRGEIMRRTGGAGVAVAFDCAGVAPAFEAALASTGPRATVAVVGMHHAHVPVPLGSVSMEEQRIVGCFGYEEGVFEEVIELMTSGAYPTKGWVEHIPVDSIVEEGIRPCERGEKMKVLVDL